MPTSVLLVASIVAGFPALIMYVIWFSPVLFGSSHEITDKYFLQSLLFACDLVQALIAVGFVSLLRMSKALDPSVRALQAPGTQSA